MTRVRPSQGTQEAKRHRRAAPPPIESVWSSGCLATLIVYLAIMVAWYAATRNLIALGLVIVGAVGTALLLSHALFGLLLLARVRLRWTRRGVQCLVVHSHSPLWEEHIASQWLARFGDRAVTLDWSQRSAWSESLAVDLFRYFGGTRNFNPAVLVFRGLRRPLVFRFYYAFHEARIGRPRYLEELEQAMFAALGLPADTPRENAPLADV